MDAQFTTAMCPFFDPECTGEIVPTSLTNVLDPIFTSAFEINGKMVGFVPEPKASAASLTPQEREEAISYLSVVLYHINVIVGPTRGAGGMTSFRDDRTFAEFPGRGSTISISPMIINNINNAHAQNNLMATQFWQFRLASLLLHELGHAMAFARLPPAWKGNCFLGNAVTCEIGFELEHRVFGGLIEKDNGMTFGPEFHDFLDFAIVQLITRGPPVSRMCLTWKVPFEYINGMFQDQFWDNLPSGGIALYRRMGCLAHANVPVSVPQDESEPNFSMTLIHPKDPRFAAFVPPGFEYSDVNGLIRRVGG